MLDVDRGDDVDAGVQQLLDVLPALRVPGAGDVRVRQLVDQRDPGRRTSTASRSSSPTAIAPRSGRRRGMTSRPSSWAAVFARPCVSTKATTTSEPRADAAVALVQHGERLADARRRSEVDATRSPAGPGDAVGGGGGAVHQGAAARSRGAPRPAPAPGRGVEHDRTAVVPPDRALRDHAIATLEAGGAGDAEEHEDQRASSPSTSVASTTSPPAQCAVSTVPTRPATTTGVRSGAPARGRRPARRTDRRCGRSPGQAASSWSCLRHTPAARAWPMALTGSQRLGDDS